MLNQSHIATFRDTGVLIVEGILDDGDLDPVIAELDEFVDREAHKLEQRGDIARRYEREPFDTRIGKLYEQHPAIIRGLSLIRMRGRAMFEFLRNEHLLDAVSCLLGSEITCNPIQHVRAKIPNRYAPDGRGNEVVPWHQDIHVTLEDACPSDIVICWIPLTDATRDTGCMQVIPGAWRLGYLPHTRDGSIAPHALPRSEPVYAECPKGGVVFLHMLTPHCSTPNISDRVRWSIDLRFQPTGTPTGRSFLPDFPVRSTRVTASVLTDHAEWCRRWQQGIEAGRGKRVHRNVVAQ